MRLILLGATGMVGAGGRSMWAGVRQRVENALRAMPFRHAGAVRPAFIRPAPGIREGRADRFVLESADINRFGA